MLIVRIVRIVRIVMVLVLISMINILSYQNKRTVTSYKTISAVIPTAMSRIISRDSNKHKRTNIFRSLSSISNSNNHPIIDKTRIKNKESVWKITYNSSLLFIGSCFSENISKQLTSRKFNVQTNPFGILFNPHSICTCIKNIVLCNYYSSNDISMDTIRKELYFSYDHHSSFSSLDKNIIIQNINNHISSGHKAICDTDVLFITLGTAKVYTHLESNKQVANCHKQPSKLFTSRLMDVTEIVDELSEAIQMCRAINSKVKIVLTVSPVRHTKDGIVENMLSKSTLVCAAHELCKNTSQVYYFPAYEYMMDELRDYRWYEEDMIHPSIAAQKYIFSEFQNKYMDMNTISLANKVHQLSVSINHRTRFPESTENKLYLEGILRSIHQIKTSFKENYNSSTNTIHGTKKVPSFSSEEETISNALKVWENKSSKKENNAT